MRPTRGGQQGHFAPYAAGSADDQSDTAAQFLFSGLTTNLGLFQSPIFDLEGFQSWQGYVIREGLEAGRVESLAALGNRARNFAFAEQCRTLHDMDGVGVELSGDAGFGLVLAEAEHAQSGDQNDGRAGIA